jgi:plastocyanin
MKRATLLLVLCATPVLVSSAGAVVHHVSIYDNYYSPGAVDVRPGDTVIWTLQEGTHTTTADVTSPKSWDSGPMSSQGQTFELPILTPDGPGPFPYHCEFHPAEMQDTIWTADTCYAAMDVNGDGLVLTVADLVYFIRRLSFDVPPMEPYYQGDINGDCVLDGGDVDKFSDYLTYGLSVFPHYPVPTCCYPDTAVGACCLGDSCSMRSEGNCVILGGEYLGTGVACLPGNPCACCQGIRGNVDADSSDQVNISDLTFLVAYLFSEGDLPPCTEEADVDGSGTPLGITDLTYLVAYLFGGGPVPPPCP